MAKYRITAPDGGTYEVTAPDDASQEQVLAYAKDNYSKLAKPEKKEANAVLDSPVGGFLRGLRDIPDAGAQLLTRGLEAVSPAGSGLETWAKGQRESVEAINKEAERDYRENWRGGQAPGIDAGRIAGNVVGTLPIAMAMPAGGATVAGRVAAGAGQGAALGTLQPVEPGAGDFWTEKAQQAGLGAAFGGLGAGAVEGISRVIAPKVAPEVADLMGRGITPTPGQIMGGAAKRAEEGLTSVPVLGDAIKSGQRRAIEQFNVAVLDDALAPIGKSLPKGSSAGREAVEEAGKMISGAYDDLLPKMTVVADQQFVGDMAALKGLAQNLADGGKQFDNIIASHIGSKFNPQTGMMTGEALKTAESELGRLARSYSSSAIAGERELGNALKEAQSVLRGAVQRSNPQFADELSAINSAYAKFLRAEEAAGRIGAKEGVFSPAQMTSAVRKMDASKGKRSFARGNALSQDLAENASSVLGNTVPDSGTPFRLANMLMMGGGAAINPAIPAAVGGGSLAYTPAGQKLIAALLAQRPAGAEATADQVRRLAPLISALSASAGPSVAQ